jgi:hypothetical protein
MHKHNHLILLTSPAFITNSYVAKDPGANSCAIVGTVNAAITPNAIKRR